MKNISFPLSEVYRLLESGPVVLVSTVRVKLVHTDIERGFIDFARATDGGTAAAKL